MRYEIALEVLSGCIAWAYGGFAAGAYRDVDLAQLKFTKKLLANERVVADRGYRQCKRFFIPKNGGKDNKVIRRILARHENVNRRIKSFDCVAGKFRHDLLLHSTCFLAVVDVAQIAIECRGKLPGVSSTRKF